jgi:hypothetical protein
MSVSLQIAAEAHLAVGLILKLCKICVNNGVKLPEQPVTINNGTNTLGWFEPLYSPADFSGGCSFVGKKFVVADRLTRCVKNGFKMISKNISSIFKFSNKLVIHFNLCRSIIFVSKSEAYFQNCLG